MKHQSINSTTSSIVEHHPSNASQNSLLISAVTNNAMINNNPLPSDILHNQQQIVNQSDTASISSQSSIMSGQNSIHNSPLVTATIPTSQLNHLNNNNGSNTSLDVMNTYTSPSLQPANMNTPPFINRSPSPSINSLVPSQTYSPQASPSVSPLVMNAQIQSVTPQGSPSLNSTQVIPPAYEQVQGNGNDNQPNKVPFGIEPTVVVSTDHKHALPAIPTQTTIPSTINNGMGQINNNLVNQSTPSNETANKKKSIMNTLSDMSLIYNSTVDSIDLESSFSTAFYEPSFSNPQFQEGNASKLIVDQPIDNRRISNNPFINDMVNGTNTINNPENNTDDNNPFNI
jgi:hypothetical protein